MALCVPLFSSLAVEKPAHIGYVFPAGGKQGSTVTVKVGGEYVYGTTAALVSGAGVSVQVLDSRDPEAGMEFKKQKNKKKNQTVIDEVVTLKVTVAPDAEPGNRDICLVTTNCLSNKLTFQVSQLNEVVECETNNTLKAANTLPVLPVLVNGVIMPGDVDAFRFFAGKGSHLVVEVSARALLPYIADGVPGWFQAVIELYNAKGRQVAVANDFQFNQDPVLLYEVPEDGEFTLVIRDSIYRGRADFIYRIKIGELPFITGIFPLGASRGEKPVMVKLAGVNLPFATMPVSAGPDVPAVQHLAVTNKGLISNPVLFSVDPLPEMIQSRPATSESKAKQVVLPVILDGCISTPHEKHFTRFDGRKGQSICLDVHARRLGSPLDSTVSLSDSQGRVLAENDDIKDKGEGFITHQADSGLTVVLPEAGKYVVTITDKQGRGGPEYVYRLRISEPIPDFDLRITPAAALLPEGGSTPLTIHAIRRDGFNGAIALSLEDSRPGLSLDGALIPEGADKAVLTVSAARNSAGPHAPRILGRAVVDGTSLIREAIPAENLMQAFLYQHLLPFREETVFVSRQGAPFSLMPRIGKEGLVMSPGHEATLPLTIVRRSGFDGPIKLQLVDPPKGISLRKGYISAGRKEALMTLSADSKITVGLNGNLIFTAIMQRERDATPEEIAWRQKALATKNGITSKSDSGTSAPPVSATAPMKVTRPVIVTLPALPFKVVSVPPANTRSTDTVPAGSRKLRQNPVK